jgi:dTDP-4-dehydrorhamnose 3,5-epimerase
MDKIIEGVILTPLKQIINAKGDIYHGMKKSDTGFSGFGEAYFSTISKDEIKGWKKHTKMVLNLIVPLGEIELIIYDDRVSSSTFNTFFSVKLSKKTIID